MDATAGVLPILRLVADEEAGLLVDLVGEAWQLVEEVHNGLVLLLWKPLLAGPAVLVDCPS